MAYGTFATGGTRMPPGRELDRVADRKGCREVQATVMGHVPLPPGTYGQVLKDFKAPSIPERHRLRHLPGLQRDAARRKDGTATESSNSNVQPTAWFVAFGPTGDPRYVVAVVIDQAGYGAAAAAPVARENFTYLSNHPIGPGSASSSTRPRDAPPIRPPTWRGIDKVDDQTAAQDDDVKRLHTVGLGCQGSLDRCGGRAVSSPLLATVPFPIFRRAS